MIMNPELLFRYAESNQQDIRIGGIDLRNDLFFMAFEESMVRSDDAQVRMLFQQIVSRGVCHARLAAEQIEAVAFFAEERQHVCAVDVFLDRITDMFRGDFHADTVRPDAIRLVQQVRVFTVLIGNIEAMRVDETAEGGPSSR